MARIPSWHTKYRRGEYHLLQLGYAVQAFLSANPYSAFEEVENKDGGIVHTWRGRIAAEPPADWSPVIGECLYNFRSALDHITWGLARAKGRKTAFPTFRSKREFDRVTPTAHLRFVRRDARAFIEELQPYRHVDGPKAHLLALLDRLSNDDKHREILGTKVGIAHINIGNPIGEKAQGDVLRFDIYGTDYRFKDGAIFIRYWSSNPNVYVPLDFAFDVALNPEGPSAGMPVLTCLGSLGIATWLVLRAVERRFFPGIVLPEAAFGAIVP